MRESATESRIINGRETHSEEHMHTKSALFSLTAFLVIGFAPCAALAAPADARLDRGAIVADLLGSWRERILSQHLMPVEDARTWAARNASRFARLTDERLKMAQQATSLGELELLFVAAPIADGTALETLSANLPGDVTVVAPVRVPAGAQAKADPTGSPTLYSDLVFTAVNPCRIYDSRFSTAPRSGPAATAWAADSTSIVDVGPETNYAFQGGQSIPCLGPLVGLSQVAAVMTAVSTVNQTGAGYLVFFPAGAANPNPYGVAQWFQPGYVQTSFVVMPTDLTANVYSVGFIGNAGSHVIVDVVGYFAKPKAAALDCVNVPSGNLVLAAGASGAPSMASCAGGYTVTGMQCHSDSSLTVISSFSESGGCAFHNGDSVSANVSVTAKCCRTPGR
jgi:hypothetical protein